MGVPPPASGAALHGQPWGGCKGGGMRSIPWGVGAVGCQLYPCTPQAGSSLTESPPDRAEVSRTLSCPPR